LGYDFSKWFLEEKNQQRFKGSVSNFAFFRYKQNFKMKKKKLFKVI
jgi:hypothetical protein